MLMSVSNSSSNLVFLSVLVHESDEIVTKLTFFVNAFYKDSKNIRI